MEDVVYIILAIVWLAISILGGKKKKKQRQSSPQPDISEPQPIEAETTTTGKKSDFEDMLEDFFGSGSEKSKAKPVPEPVYEEDDYEKGNRSAFDQPKRDKGGSIKSAPWTYMSEDKKKEFEGEVEEDFEFTAEGKVETLEDLIKSYERTDKKTEEEDAKLAVVDLDGGAPAISGLDFDARKAIIYAEIINRKYF